jgi:lipoate-protein ligase A
VNRKHSTFNIQLPTPKSPDGGGRTLAVERSKLNVGCSAPLQRWLLLQSGPGDPAFNMALDEALLESVSRLGLPVLRFYGWTEPAATFGYFQKYADVERATLLRPLIRRPTGGGIVPHDADWTYSVAFPPGHEWHSLKAEESYRRVHEWIQSAFAKLDVTTELAPCSKKTRPSTSSRREEAHTKKSETSQSLTSAATSVLPGQCFTGYEKFDVLWHGKKIAGAAQRRNKLGLLIQGSVQPPPVSLARTDWQKAMSYMGQVEFGVEWSDFAPDGMLRDRAESLAAQKYSRAAYNCKR